MNEQTVLTPQQAAKEQAARQTPPSLSDGVLLALLTAPMDVLERMLAEMERRAIDKP